MKYYIGIDGGGSKTKVVLTDKELDIYDQDSSGPANFLTEGKEKAAFVVTELIWAMMQGSGIRSIDVSGASVCLAGVGRIEDQKLLREEIDQLLKKKGIFINNIIIDSDARAALMGAHSGKPGCILIAGTGSVLFGQTKDGEFFRCGGFGRIIGDEGGGYSIGRKALNLLARTMDGREKISGLTKLLTSEMNLNTQDELIDGVYKGGTDIPSAAAIVIRAAGENDNTAAEILNSESDELVKLIEVAHPKFKREGMVVSFSGGLIEKDNFYSSLIKEKVKKKFPDIKLKELDYPPEIGAILLTGLKN